MLETSGLMIVALDITTEAIIEGIHARIVMIDVFMPGSMHD
jgi:hypothetical protein